MKIIEGKIVEPERICIYGPEGIGKTTMASMFPDPLFLDCERSTSHISCRRVMITSQAEFEAACAEIALGKVKCKTLVIDTIDALQTMVRDKMLSEYRRKSLADWGWGDGYTILFTKMQRILDILENIQNRTKITIALFGHSQIKQITLPEEAGSYDRYELALEKKVKDAVKHWVYTLLFVNYSVDIVTDKNKKTRAVGGTVRKIRTVHTAYSDGKNRWELPDEIIAGSTIEDMLKIVKTHILPNVAKKKAEPKPKKEPEMPEVHNPIKITMDRDGLRYWLNTEPIVERHFILFLGAIKKINKNVKRLEDIPEKTVLSILKNRDKVKKSFNNWKIKYNQIIEGGLES